MSGLAHQVRTVSLADVVAAATLVLVVREADPPVRVVELPLDPSPEIPGVPRPANPPTTWSFRTDRFVVDEVLRGDAAVGATIEVPSVGNHAAQSLARDAARGISSWPVILRSQLEGAAAPPAPGEPFLVFLRGAGEYTMHGDLRASVARRAEVEALLRPSRPPPSWRDRLRAWWRSG